MSEEVLCVSEYAEDIHLHLRESEVRNYLNYFHHITVFWAALNALQLGCVAPLFIANTS